MARAAAQMPIRLPVMPGRRALVVMASALAVAAAGLLGYPWLRDSSLLEVRETTIEGVSGYQAEEIRRSLERAAAGMSTMDIDLGVLRSAVDKYPTVRAISADADLPHGLVISVEEDRPVAVLAAGDRKMAVAADGRLLPGVPAGEVATIPTRGTLTPGAPVAKETLAVLRAIQAAPADLKRQIRFAAVARDTGLTFQLRNGVALRFGGQERLRAKWLAAAGVLGDPEAERASYIDLRAPDRPAVGGLEPAAASVPGAEPDQNPQVQPEP